jgi:hypothetical protein
LAASQAEANFWRGQAQQAQFSQQQAIINQQTDLLEALFSS